MTPSLISRLQQADGPSRELLRKAVYEAALQWCSEKERETFPEDIEYFKYNWLAFQGFRDRVEAILKAKEAQG